MASAESGADEDEERRIMSLLLGPGKMERDRGAVELQRLLNSGPGDGGGGGVHLRLGPQLLASAGSLIPTSVASPCEARLGALVGAKVLVPHLHPNENRCEAELAEAARDVALRTLDDPETRVRVAAGEVLGALCRQTGVQTFLESREVLLDMIRSSIEQSPVPADEEEAPPPPPPPSSSMLLDVPDKMGPLSRRRGSELVGLRPLDGERGGSGAVTVASRLETTLRCLRSMADGCSTALQPHVDRELLLVVISVLAHRDRYVREAGFAACAAIMSSCIWDGESEFEREDMNPVFAVGHELCGHLAKGLEDTWSQVRLAACVAVRKFFLALPEKSRNAFYPQLLPRMCLNRYYMVAEGVRLYSQETWRQVAGAAGVELVESHLEAAVAYYEKVALDADGDAAAREASCSCFGEVAAKLSHCVVRPHTGRMLKVLLTCFRDDCWPVRDAACMACGSLVSCFPDESRSSLPEMLPLFQRSLQDSVATVRQGAAAALACVVRSLGSDALAAAIHLLEEGLAGVQQQPATGAGAGAGVGMALESTGDNRPLRQIFMSASYTQRIGRSASTTGWSDNPFNKPTLPWHFADGCIHLLTELAQVAECMSAVIAAVPLAAEACQYRHYESHVCLLETVCKQLPLLAKALGKKSFKALLPDFLEPVFYALECENSLTSSASSQCLNQLGSILGPNVLRAMVQQLNPRFLQHLDANVYIAPF
ncbi:uncharacterized protein LOC124551038 isoform X1 [Schistocerca americana]|uniref:uncharacterized protein LOC124551038 isoform X1 n=1 Tax=Schistocerca americana TaxID=7009 RepID=UPI001F4F113A|nr:uncharacterized protein LOC124551038 isoform X1 [Schistocerca americana]